MYIFKKTPDGVNFAISTITLMNYYTADCSTRIFRESDWFRRLIDYVTFRRVDQDELTKLHLWNSIFYFIKVPNAAAILFVYKIREVPIARATILFVYLENKEALFIEYWEYVLKLFHVENKCKLSKIYDKEQGCKFIRP